MLDLVPSDETIAALPSPYREKAMATAADLQRNMAQLAREIAPRFGLTPEERRVAADDIAREAGRLLDEFVCQNRERCNGGFVDFTIRHHIDIYLYECAKDFATLQAILDHFGKDFAKRGELPN